MEDKSKYNSIFNHKINCQCMICKSKRGEYKGENNPNFGNTFSQSLIARQRISKSLIGNKRALGKKKTEEQRKEISKRMTGKGNPMYGYCKPKKHKLNCQCFICKGERGETKGKNHPCYGKHFLRTSKKLKNKCICGREISFYAKQCKECYYKERKQISIKNKRKYYCINCYKLIKTNSLRCHPCSQKNRLKIPENNPNYIDGRSFLPYPTKFNSKLKKQIKQRDNYTCQHCGTNEIEHKLKYKNMGLTIHHIDYNKQNCDPENLITLCTKCNSIANAQREYWNEYYWRKVI